MLGKKAPKESRPTKFAIEYVELDSIFPSASNARTHSEEQIEKLAGTILEYGFDQPIVARRADRTIIKGHGRVRAAALLGLEQVPVTFVDDDEIRALGRGVSDNLLSDLAGWNHELLEPQLLELKEHDLPTIISDEELSAMLEGIGKGDGDGKGNGDGASDPSQRFTIWFDSDEQRERWEAFVAFLDTKYASHETLAGRLHRYLVEQGPK